VIGLDGVGYLIAVNHLSRGDQVLVTVLEDIFVAVALLTITVGLVLPGMIALAAGEVATAAERLGQGTITDLTVAMQALGRGDLDAAHVQGPARLRSLCTPTMSSVRWPPASTECKPS